MKRHVIVFLTFGAGSSWAQAQTTTVVPSPFQALGNILRYPQPPPPPPPPPTGTSRPLALPTAIPPSTVGTTPGR